MELIEAISTKINYWDYVIILMIGLYAMIAKNNMIKKLIGMSIFQTAIILFYVSIGVKEGATIPILYHDQVHAAHSDQHEADTSHGAVESHGTDLQINADDFTNPLPHVLMLTAIVVGVSTLGVGLAITQKLHREFGSIEESEILEMIKSGK